MTSGRYATVVRFLWLFQNLRFMGLPLLSLPSPGFPTANDPAPSTSIQLFIGNSPNSIAGPEIKISPDTSAVRFLIDTKDCRVRFKLEGAEDHWKQIDGQMNLSIRFFDQSGDQILQKTYPANGTSKGWHISAELSDYTARFESVEVPPAAVYLVVAVSTAGPAAAVGVIAVSNITITSPAAFGGAAVTYLENNYIPNQDVSPWLKQGSHPSLATSSGLDANGRPLVLMIVDDDIMAHADWLTDMHALPMVTPGQTLNVSWKEAYNNGVGDPLPVTYERLPPGQYRFIVEDLGITGLPNNLSTSLSFEILRPYWRTVKFWFICIASAALVAFIYVNYLVRRKINRHLRHSQIIAQERLRIARDLHDDLGTRLSHISLMSSYALSPVGGADPHATLERIRSMTGELIRSLFDTVWMLNPENGDLEALVDNLCRLASDLCRLSMIRCRIDAMSEFGNTPISHEVRHSVTLAVKEALSNALKHSRATEINLRILRQGSLLQVSIIDNGSGSPSENQGSGTGLASIAQRMESIGGKCRMNQLDEGGMRVILEAPIS